MNLSAGGDLSIIVRTVGERTTAACVYLLQKARPETGITIVNEVPFSRAIRKCFEHGIDTRCKWTLVIDADVLIRAAFIGEIVEFASKQDDKTFVVQGLVYDKFFNVFRPAGNHLYRTEHLSKALACIPEDGSSLRPESSVIDEMIERGCRFVQKEFVAGIHDFEQNPLDIAKKCFVQARKHKPFVKEIWPQWQEKALKDEDYRFAMLGVEAGNRLDGKLYIDSHFVEGKVHTAYGHHHFSPKPPLAPGEYDDARVQQQLVEAWSEPGREHMQAVMFPRWRWYHVYGSGKNQSSVEGSFRESG